MLSRYFGGHMRWVSLCRPHLLHSRTHRAAFICPTLSFSTKTNDWEEGSTARQLHSELKVVESRDRVMKDAWEGLKLIGRGASVKKAQRKIGDWYYPVTQMLDREKSLINEKVPGEDRMIYGPYLTLLDSHKLAVMTLEVVMSSVIRCGNNGVPLMKLMLELGNAIESDYKVNCITKSRETSLNWAKKQLKAASGSNSLKTYLKIKRILKDDQEWTSDLKVKLGSVLLKAVLVACKYGENESAFDCELNYSSSGTRRLGVFKMNPSLFAYFTDLVAFIPPSYPPMLVAPKPWDNKKYVGAYFNLSAPIMKHNSRKQAEAVKMAKMEKVLEGLDFLGSIPWKINSEMLHLIENIVELGDVIGEIQPKHNLIPPTFEDFFKELSQNPKLVKSRLDTAEPTSEDVLKFARSQYRGLCSRIAKKNAEMHSLRCDLQIKLSVARDFERETVFFPHNMDFRGRAYPIPPNLNHLGSDLCRSLLVFAERKPLGAEGLRWLKVHIANLSGYNKVSFDDRVHWVDQHLEDIRDSAANPLDGKRWWVHSENPFQTLAACRELHFALQAPDPRFFESSIPIHQDGSCNGLQHYASLSRDKKGGQAVNLLNAPFPQDVYSSVLEVVKRKVQEDATLDLPAGDSPLHLRKHRATRVKDVVNRKVIKQTVMTSVYGVTFTGAKAQIQARLYEAFGLDAALLTSEEDNEIYGLASYLQKLLSNLFKKSFKMRKRLWTGLLMFP